MKMKFVLLGLIVLFSLAGVWFVYKSYVYIKPDSDKYNSFKEWRKENAFHGERTGNDQLDSIIVESPYLLVDTIFRSMEGPFTCEYAFLNKHLFARISSIVSPELIWLTGYKVELYDDKGNRLSDDYMCHNNLNIAEKNVLPWKVKTKGTDKRLFTLTEGQVDLHLPPSTGIPVMSDQRLRVDFQVLNHNVQNINLKVKQVVTVYYKKDKDCKQEMTPLYQQSMFVTKQLSGPIGGFDEVPLNDSVVANTSHEEVKLCCSKPNDMIVSEGFPFKDKYNRLFTGHWTLPDSVEYLKVNADPFLNLKQDEIVYFFSAHVHPFCQYLELFDETDLKSVYRSEAVNFKDKIGLEKIGAGVFPQGIGLSASHHYTLRSVYHKTRPEKHTAMATMFLYLKED